MFLELDKSIFYGNNIENDYKNKSVYIYNYLYGLNVQFSFGKITDVMTLTNSGEKHIFYTGQTFNGSGGAPILLSNSNKVITVNQGKFAFGNKKKVTNVRSYSSKSY